MGHLCSHHSSNPDSDSDSDESTTQSSQRRHSTSIHSPKQHFRHKQTTDDSTQPLQQQQQPHHNQQRQHQQQQQLEPQHSSSSANVTSPDRSALSRHSNNMTIQSSLTHNNNTLSSLRRSPACRSPIQQPPEMKSPMRVNSVLHYDKLIKGRDADGRRVLNERYVLLESIGSGGVAAVDLCFDLQLNCHWAVKKMSKRTLMKQREYSQAATITQALPISAASPASLSHSAASPPSSLRPRMFTGLDKVSREIALMKQVWHENVVKLHAVVDDAQEDGLFLIMEYCEGGQIMEFDADMQVYTSKAFPHCPLTGGLSESHCRQVMHDVVRGLEYLHSLLIIHRDCKPDNILCSIKQQTDNQNKTQPSADNTVDNNKDRDSPSSNHSLSPKSQQTDTTSNVTSLRSIIDPSHIVCKLSDLGCARQFESRSPTRISDTHGTFSFFSPEMCSGEAYDPFKSDIWSLGVTLYILVTGVVPFMKSDQSAQQLFDAIQNEQLQFPPQSKLSPQLTSLIDRILVKQPEQRLTLAQIRGHEWMRVAADN